nr:cell division cycle-related protein res2/pct1 [Quercus suber]
MSRLSNTSLVYSATYSNVPVYEFNIDGNHVMRRRHDDWINATHILKVAEYDKPARTRILEREVQKGVHEKVQGGYGKYQGTWIPLEDGKALAAKNGVAEKLMPIFDYEQGEKSPPPAPKHQTQQRPKATKPAQRKQAPGKSTATTISVARTAALTMEEVYQQDYDQMDIGLQDPGTPAETLESESQFDDYDGGLYTNPRKRRRLDDPLSQADRDHAIWAEELLDYFVLQDTPQDYTAPAPVPPSTASLNRSIDDRGHTALHWAAAMADLEVVKDLIRRGANIDCQSKNGETPLMRAVAFTNSFDRRNMERLASLLVRTVNMQEWSGSTVFHHIAGITESKKKYDCARYYLDCILNKMAEVFSPDQIERVLNEQDANGDTAVTIAARNGARKCVRSLIGRNAAVDIPNSIGESADTYIQQLNVRRQERSIMARQQSSSPFQADSQHAGSTFGGGAVQPPGIPFNPLVPHSSLLRSGAASPDGNTAGVYKSDSALALSTQVLPLFTTKNNVLATAYESEIAEKDAEVVEAERVLAIRRSERDQLKRQQEEIRIKELDQTAGDSQSDEQLFAELLALECECEDLTIEEENSKLATLLSSEISKLASPPDDAAEADPNAMNVLREQLSLARELVTVMREREQLSKAIVKSLSVAGVSEKSAGYKKLIVGALGVTEDDVESMLPDIVNELEEARAMEAVGA